MLDNTKPFPKVVSKSQMNPLLSLSGKYCNTIAHEIIDIMTEIYGTEDVKNMKRLNAHCIKAIVNRIGIPRGFEENQFWFKIDQAPRHND